jgi:surfeit locus 1 family protein
MPLIISAIDLHSLVLFCNPSIVIMIKNWKLAVLALVFFCLFTALGVWQVKRANQKKILLKSFTERTAHAPLSAQDLSYSTDWRFYRIQLQGRFDNTHTFLLDNKIRDGKIGYEVYTPFKAKHLATLLLIDRGFVPIGINRQTLPAIKAIEGEVTINGLLNLPPTYAAQKELYETLNWPLRVEFINLSLLANVLNKQLFPYLISLNPEDPAAYPIKWQITVMGPERHMGYAVQWFALALTLLVLFVALNRGK